MSAVPGAENAAVAQALREMADLLDARHGNPYRALAYRRAADTVAALHASVRYIFEREGTAGLDALPTIGPSIAAAIAELLRSGRWGLLEHERAAADPLALLQTIPGVGAALAVRLRDALGVSTLEALELAVHDGRLVQLLGARRAAAIGASLTQMLDRARTLRLRGAAARVAPQNDADSAVEPAVSLLLALDREYRNAAAAGRLPTIAPRRFNPTGESWLPVLHTRRGDWRLTALFSNTARAHEFDRVHDWVVIYAEDRAHVEHTYTVVTAARGTLAGRRVVRGREAACRAWYDAQQQEALPA